MGSPLPPPKLLTLPWNCLQISRTTPSNFSPLKNSTTTCTKCMSSPWDDVTWKQASYTSELYKVHKRAIQGTQASYKSYSGRYLLYSRVVRCLAVKYSKSWPLKTTWKSWNVSLGLYLSEMGHGPLPEYKSGSYLNICIVSPDISHPPRVYIVPPSYLEGSVCCGDYLQPHW